MILRGLRGTFAINERVTVSGKPHRVVAVRLQGEPPTDPEELAHPERWLKDVEVEEIEPFRKFKNDKRPHLARGVDESAEKYRKKRRNKNKMAKASRKRNR